MTNNGDVCPRDIEAASRSRTLAERRTLVAQHRRLSARYETLLDNVRSTAEAGQKNLETARILWEQVSNRRARFVFWLSARIDGNRRFAAWSSRGLTVHPDLAARAEIVIQLGETFRAPDTGSVMAPGLDEPIRAALTLIRASDEVLGFSLRVDALTIEYGPLIEACA